MSAVALEYRQFHNQPADSPLHRALDGLWRAVEEATGGQLRVRVCPQHDGIAGGDPEALRMLVRGDVELLTLMNGLVSAVVPVADVTGLPFAFPSHAAVFAALDGELGEYLRGEMRAQGIHALPRATMENGFRQITSRGRPIRTVDDLAGLRIRTPAGRMFLDFFETLGARPRAVNLNQLYDALKNGVVEAQENPLVMTEVNRLWEVQTHVSVTSHMWSGFNLLANLAAWERLPADTRETAERIAAHHAARQRRDTDELNRALAVRLAARGMVFNEADTATFRRPLAGFYARWKRELGQRAWALVEAQAGPLG